MGITLKMVMSLLTQISGPGITLTPVFLSFKTLSAHYSLPSGCILGEKDGRK